MESASQQPPAEPPAAPPPPAAEPYPLTFAVEYPAEPLNRLTTFFRLFTVIPIAIVLASITGYTTGFDGPEYTIQIVVSGIAFLFFPPLLMILFRKKYPAWWAEWNRELLRFSTRIHVYLVLMTDRYPSTDERQSVGLDFANPDAERELMRGMPLVKWLLAIPHYVILFMLEIAVFFVVVFSWFAILFTGRYPRALFDFVEGVIRWQNRVFAYAFLLVTDKYPPFRLSP